MPPRDDLGDAEFVRADIRNPVIAKVIASADVDTVVHMSVHRHARAAPAAGRSMKEINVIGTMQLLAACQKAPGVRKLVVKSSIDGLRRVAAGPGDVHRGHGARRAAALRLRQGRPSRSRATCAASPAAAPTSRVTMLRLRQRARAPRATAR